MWRETPLISMTIFPIGRRSWGSKIQGSTVFYGVLQGSTGFVPVWRVLRSEP
jgi:hypothetical protein